MNLLLFKVFNNALLSYHSFCHRSLMRRCTCTNSKLTFFKGNAQQHIIMNVSSFPNDSGLPLHHWSYKYVRIVARFAHANSLAFFSIACATDKTKSLVKSVYKPALKSLFWALTCVPEQLECAPLLPVKKSILNLPVRLKRNSIALWLFC